MDFAYSSKNSYVPKTERWLASMSDGRTIFLDITPYKKSAWLRLKDFVKDTDCYITNVRLEAYTQKIICIPYRHPETGETQVDGYWHSKKMGYMTHTRNGSQVDFMGIGFIKGDQIFITWVRQDGHILNEIRSLYKEDGTIEPGAILQ